MIDNKPFAMFFNASPRKGWNTHKMLEAAKRAHRNAQFPIDLANARALGKLLVEKAKSH
jgi:multimeric flavodoxin WrbA